MKCSLEICLGGIKWMCECESYLVLVLAKVSTHIALLVWFLMNSPRFLSLGDRRRATHGFLGEEAKEENRKKRERGRDARLSLSDFLFPPSCAMGKEEGQREEQYLAIFLLPVISGKDFLPITWVCCVCSLAHFHAYQGKSGRDYPGTGRSSPRSCVQVFGPSCKYALIHFSALEHSDVSIAN